MKKSAIKLQCTAGFALLFPLLSGAGNAHSLQSPAVQSVVTAACEPAERTINRSRADKSGEVQGDYQLFAERALRTRTGAYSRLLRRDATENNCVGQYQGIWWPVKYGAETLG